MISDPEHTRPDDDKDLTVLGWPETMLRSQYGTIPYGEWCRLEAWRIGRTRAYVREAFGMVCVALR